MTAHKPLAIGAAMTLATVLLCAGAQPTAADAMRDIRFAEMQEIQLACGEFGRAAGMKSGVMGANGIIHRDLTGDGVKDLIVDHRAIVCVNGLTLSSRTCDESGCALRVFVSNWAGFAFHIERKAASYTVSDDELPIITLTDADGTQTLWRWDGTYFSEIDLR